MSPYFLTDIGDGASMFVNTFVVTSYAKVGEKGETWYLMRMSPSFLLSKLNFLCILKYIIYVLVKMAIIWKVIMIHSCFMGRVDAMCLQWNVDLEGAGNGKTEKN